MLNSVRIRPQTMPHCKRKVCCHINCIRSGQSWVQTQPSLDPDSTRNFTLAGHVIRVQHCEVYWKLLAFYESASSTFISSVGLLLPSCRSLSNSAAASRWPKHQTALTHTFAQHDNPLLGSFKISPFNCARWSADVSGNRITDNNVYSKRSILTNNSSTARKAG
jgi:hypothetical protein